MSTESSISSPYVRIDAVAKYFDVSTSTVRTWVTEGKIPETAFIRSGRTYRFRLSQVEAALLGTTEKSEEKSPQMSLDFSGDAA